MHVLSQEAHGKDNLEKRKLVQHILRAVPVAAVGFLQRRPSVVLTSK
jgi:hypothetical protein